MSRYLNFAVFLAGLAAVCWIGTAYAGSNPLAFAVTMLVGTCYLAGALELRRFSAATSTLARAVARLAEPPPSFNDWLEALHPSLRNVVRLRVQGERVALPGPTLTPYLVGMLVLLGMLGTLLGMVATLRGTGLALDSATDLQAIRASLAAPVKGLGFAFGTSIAGVATSAMLGLLSALVRRERIKTAQILDMKIATTLRIYSKIHQREETFRLLQRQAEMMPTLVDRLQTMMATIEQQSAAFNERQIASQNAFHANAEASYMRLATSVEQSLKENIAESARVASEALQPVVATTMAGLARETASLHDAVTHAVERHVDELSTRFGATTTTVAEIWNNALANHQRSSEAQALDLRIALERFTETFEQRSAALVESVSARLDAAAGNVSETWNQALSRQEHVSGKLASHNEQALAAAAMTFEQHATSLLRTVSQSHADLQTNLASRDEQRLAVWTGTLGEMAATLNREWEQAGTRTASRQQEICDTLAQTARDMAAQTQAHVSGTIVEISRLVQVASEAPRAAAEVVAELRQKLSDSMVRDTAMLDERTRLLETLETLLDGVSHASSRQREAVDALVATSTDLLERVGAQLTERIEAETGKLSAVAADVTVSAVEVASLGEAFGVAVQLFGDSNETLVTHLQRIESALDKSLVRSDEQLAYYVAQAREVIDLSMMSQKQIVENLQQLAGQRASIGVGPA
ncbi:DUF802 domain-containing protein [Paraburkholderia saeva]|uniref:DUF802 domain-containing protein n=1 Tax=Paraburkholderia saeva TaxID=2777537 RepID=A0A9N8RVG8_9BURK|nr:DUF802 domain-containing protein [Paraburkholderia saeva]CAG4894855.1 hypothetical protein LMG31841_02012 [Paraburkholderia saeva]